MDYDYTALICVRGGSKGLPGKNIRLLAGVPLLTWAIRAAKKVSRISRIIVSTDSQEIAKVAIQSGAEVPFIRPESLAQDNSSEWQVWQHALRFVQDQGYPIDGLVSVPATAPLRASKDIEACLDTFEAGDVDTVITVTDAHRSPYFNMVKSDNSDYVSLVIPPKNKITRRQDVPEVFDMTTVAYTVSPNFLLSNNGLFDGRVKSVYVPPERALDIDTLFDFKIAECLIQERKDLIK